MKLKKKLLILVGVLIAVVFISGVSILAVTSFGTQTDPLVTLSYLTEQFKPKILSDVNAEISAVQASLQPALDAKVSAFEAEIEEKQSASASEAASFSLVTLNKGQTVVCNIGTDLLLRIGTATATGSSTALVDSTSGNTLATGKPLVANHLYMVSIQGNGLKATAAGVKILIRGTYTIS